MSGAQTDRETMTPVRVALAGMVLIFIAAITVLAWMSWGGNAWLVAYALTISAGMALLVSGTWEAVRRSREVSR